MSFSTSGLLSGTCAVMFLVACGSGPLPKAEFANAKAAISAAEASGAGQVPQAALHVKMAKNGVAEAEEQMDEGENEEAKATLERASADAQLASKLTREQKIRSEANAAVQRTEQLRTQTTF